MLRTTLIIFIRQGPQQNRFCHEVFKYRIPFIEVMLILKSEIKWGLLYFSDLYLILIIVLYVLESLGGPSF